MRKINREEYQVLKNLDDKWEWVARDSEGQMYTFVKEPYKDDRFKHWRDYTCDWKRFENNLFRFIQWEDEKPKNIQELIKEYEREGMEVKKNKEWAFIELGKLFPSHAEMHDSPDYTTVMKCELLNKVYDILKQLDEPETLSKEWIDEYSIDTNVDTFNGDIFVTFILDDLKELLVPKQEITEEQVSEYLRERSMTAVDSTLVHRENLDSKIVTEIPIIPEFVAEFLDGKEDYMLHELFDDEWLYNKHDQIAKWLYDNDEKINRERELSLVLAHRHGYEVEVEQRYYVMNNDQRMMLVRMMDGKTITEADPFKLEDMYESEKKAHRLTEKEIKDYDERYFAFAKPVEEVEG